MLYHRVAKYLGEAERGGRKIYGHLATCGARIIAATQLGIGSTVTMGVEPHAQCAKCFDQSEAHNDVKLPEDPLAGDVYDENGKKLSAFRAKEDNLSAPIHPRSVLKEGNGLGQYENRPYG